MKSLLFTHFYEKLMDKSKQQTIRLLMCPNYIITEWLLLRFKFEKKKKPLPLFVIVVTDLFPIQMKDIDHEIATRDGFDSVEECVRGLAEINGDVYLTTNKIKPNFMKRWGFVTRWKDLPKKHTLEAYF